MKQTRKTWRDLLSADERQHLRDTGTRSAAHVCENLQHQNDQKMVCHECRHIAQVLRRERPDLHIPEPAPWSVMRPDWPETSRRR